MKVFTASILIIGLSSLISCNAQSDLKTNKVKPEKKESLGVSETKGDGWIDPNGKNVKDRILIPEGFKRSEIKKNSFHEYMLNHPLKPDGSYVDYFDGSQKRVSGVYCAVFDQNIGTRDLHQCADAVMNLWASYLYKTKQYDRIHFNFTSGHRADYKKYAEGYRAVIKGSKVSWVKKSGADYSEKTFRNYMNLIYSYCGTASLSKEMKSVQLDSIEPGDVFILGGHPGHAVLVLDVVTNKDGDKAFLLSQSYMPAQQNQVLLNPLSEQNSPWYFLSDLKVQGELETPEWTFKLDQLKRFTN